MRRVLRDGGERVVRRLVQQVGVPAAAAGRPSNDDDDDRAGRGEARRRLVIHLVEQREKRITSWIGMFGVFSAQCYCHPDYVYMPPGSFIMHANSRQRA